MKNSSDLTIVIPGKHLYMNRVCYVSNAKYDPGDLPKSVIIGKVIYPEGKIPVGACVEIVEIGEERKSIGCTFSDEKGEYELPFSYKPYLNYELNIYDIVLTK